MTSHGAKEFYGPVKGPGASPGPSELVLGRTGPFGSLHRHNPNHPSPRGTLEGLRAQRGGITNHFVHHEDKEGGQGNSPAH